ncbi:hypothetical protein GALMADRAFT_908596 [Galerina marginata CBS 339.88]|uniref:Rhodopsin domain-containing protein n=1 Tax=Galerina marginata (strain CBS 339.88) TaxID=685588 RepID=A0A067SFV3_GALM3|nr:hypothetical protein GALMADRAFT_908596 [Galerina marginata CBS 339.88]
MAPLALPPQSYLGWKVSVIALHAIAIISTIYRLIHRFRLRQTWWDDYIVTIPLVVDVAFSSLVAARFPTEDKPNDTISFSDEVYNSYWLTTLPCLIILWSTRTVLALSLARVFPCKHPARRWSFILVAFMVLSCIASIAVTIGTCKQTSGLLNQDAFKDCVKGLGGFPLKDIFLIADDLVSDALLVISPIVMLWRLRLPRNEHRLILMVFCGSTMMLLSAVCFMVITNSHSISMGENAILLVTSLGNTEASFSLFACNLTVIATCFCGGIRNLLHREGQDVESAPATPTPTQSSRSCSCLSDRSPTPLTLTEISESSSIPRSRFSRGSPHPSQTSSHPARISPSRSQCQLGEKASINDSDDDLGRHQNL